MMRMLAVVDMINGKENMMKRIKGKVILNLDTEWRNFCLGAEVEKEIFRNSLRRSTDCWGWGGRLLQYGWISCFLALPLQSFCIYY